ncbi:hypothetical protein LGH83_04645 [Lichenihabitans sp. PAMC28606]|uniref:hypothetical protein n=1 Tax=Lichenihabitans sp. PAMC28606 TaxID=2880932 RepID=UPI001D0A704C|nr:hypothetical protein [Lichenihabitans sp. PAMC28606]UDL95516.1 hypothetical protein LGH83_04645 [Lichenihabitans sp. PAMC28606]
MLYNPPTGGAANDAYVGKNPAAGIQGSKIPPGAAEFPQREIVAVEVAAGLSPTNDDLQQLLKAIRSGKLCFWPDTGTADALLISPNPAYGDLSVGTEFAILKGNLPNATTTSTLTVNGLTFVIVKEDGSALAIGDLPANVLFAVRSDGTRFRVVGLRKSDAFNPASVQNLINSSTTINTTTQNYIDRSSPKGMTYLEAFAPVLDVSDLAVGPSFTALVTSGNFTGADFVQVSASCALRQADDSGSLIGYTVRIQLNDVTTGTNVQGAYLGGGATLTGTAQIQFPFSVPLKIFQGLNPAHVYNLQIVAQKGSSSAPIQGYDGHIFGYHDGSNQ